MKVETCTEVLLYTPLVVNKVLRNYVASYRTPLRPSVENKVYRLMHDACAHLCSIYIALHKAFIIGVQFE